jgi:hypothetical protein
MRLTSRHAEVIGGVMVEPGQDFDESQLDSKEIDRLVKEGKARDVMPPKKQSASKGSE